MCGCEGVAACFQGTLEEDGEESAGGDGPGEGDEEEEPGDNGNGADGDHKGRERVHAAGCSGEDFMAGKKGGDAVRNVTARWGEETVFAVSWEGSFFEEKENKDCDEAFDSDGPPELDGPWGARDDKAAYGGTEKGPEENHQCVASECFASLVQEEEIDDCASADG